jgi:hypothetical protein
MCCTIDYHFNPSVTDRLLIGYRYLGRYLLSIPWYMKIITFPGCEWILSSKCEAEHLGSGQFE